MRVKEGGARDDSQASGLGNWLGWRHRKRNRFGSEDDEFGLGLAKSEVLLGQSDGEQLLGPFRDNRVNFKYVNMKDLWGGSKLRRRVRAIPSWEHIQRYVELAGEVIVRRGQ